MLLTFVNLTSDSITISRPQTKGFCRSSQHNDSNPEEISTIMPSQAQDVPLQGRWNNELLFAAQRSAEQQQSGVNKASWLVNPETLPVRVSLTLGASWQTLNVPQDCPWRMYCSQAAKNHHKVLMLRKRSMSSFLAQLLDTLSLSALVLPGTHESMAFYGYPLSQCQSPYTPVSTQLLSGIRVLDIRLAIINNQLLTYHGIYPQRTPFSSILASVHAFLTSPQGSSEVVIMSIKQEDFAVNPYLKFSMLVKESMMANPGGWQECDGSKDRGMWFLENRIPTLGEARGKVVLFSRFGGNGEGWEGGWEGMGIHPLSWPDSRKDGFEWTCKDTLVRTHDWYNIPSFLSIPEKVALSTKILVPDSPESSLRAPLYKPVYIASTPQSPPLAISYLSASSFPLSLPPVIARGFGWPKWGFGVEGVNSRVGRWLLDVLGGEDKVDTKMTSTGLRKRRGCSWKPLAANGDPNKAQSDEKHAAPIEAPDPRIRGWVLMDYFGEPENGGLVPLLVECNFYGRRAGEEGWP